MYSIFSKLILSILIAIVLSFGADNNIIINTAYAETYTVEADGVYVMGDSDSRERAKRKAIEDAKRYAIEKIGTYVEGFTQVNNYQVTADEIRSIAAGIVRIQEKNTTFVTQNDHWICKAHITAVINCSDIDMEQAIAKYGRNGSMEIDNSDDIVSPRKLANSRMESDKKEELKKITGLKLIGIKYQQIHMDTNDELRAINSKKLIYGVNAFPVDKRDAYRTPFGLAASIDETMEGRSGAKALTVQIFKIEKSNNKKIIYVSELDAEMILKANSCAHFLEKMAVDIVNI